MANILTFKRNFRLTEAFMLRARLLEHKAGEAAASTQCCRQIHWKTQTSSVAVNEQLSCCISHWNWNVCCTRHITLSHLHAGSFKSVIHRHLPWFMQYVLRHFFGHLVLLPPRSSDTLGAAEKNHTDWVWLGQARFGEAASVAAGYVG